MRPELALALLHFAGRHLEPYGLVRLGGKEKVLPLAVWRLDLLLVGGHEAVTRNNGLRDFRVVHLKEQRLLAVAEFTLLGHPVAGSSNLDELLRFHAGLLGRQQRRGCLLCLLGGSSCQIILMLLALRVGQIAALVVVQRQAEFALVGAQMVLHEVRILVQIDCLQGQLTQSLLAVAVRLRPGGYASAAGLAAGAVLEVHFVNFILVFNRTKEKRFALVKFHENLLYRTGLSRNANSVRGGSLSESIDSSCAGLKY